MVRYRSSSYKVDFVIVIKNFLNPKGNQNPKGHQNPISGSKVTAIYWRGVFCLFVELQRGRVCACSLRSRVVFKLMKKRPQAHFKVPLGFKRMCAGNQFKVEQYSDVWVLSRLKPTFLCKNKFALICDVILLKNDRFNRIMTKSLTTILGKIWIFVDYFFFSSDLLLFYSHGE